MSGHRVSQRGRRPAEPVVRRYPRAVRVNEVLREVLAEALERLSDHDERFALLTITAVRCDPDLRHARVLLASLDEAERAALEAVRVRLQAAVAQEVRLKRTPQLSFAADPAVADGARIEAILRRLHDQGELPDQDSPDSGPAPDPDSRDPVPRFDSRDPEPGEPSDRSANSP